MMCCLAIPVITELHYVMQVCLDLWSGHRTKTTYSSERLTPLQRKQVTALQTSYERWNKGKA